MIHARTRLTGASSGLVLRWPLIREEAPRRLCLTLCVCAGEGGMSLEIHKIKEIHPGIFWMLLDFPTSQLLSLLLSDEYQYVWCHNHRLGNYSWDKYHLPLFNDKVSYEVLSRFVLFDFTVPTKMFKEMLPNFDAGIHVIQLNRQPPDYFDLDKVRGKERYRLLGECEWLFEFEVPGNDYGQIASSNKQLLQNLQQHLAMGVNDLP